MELMHHVIANDFQLHARDAAEKKKGSQIEDIFSEGEDGKSALFLMASSYGLNTGGSDTATTTAAELYDNIERDLATEIRELLDKFDIELREAHTLSLQASISGLSCTQYNHWLFLARSNDYGDHETAVHIRSSLAGVNGLLANETVTDPIPALRTLAGNLNTYCEELVALHRKLRTFKSVRQIQRAEVLICSRCEKETAASDITLLAGCGHLTCGECAIPLACGVVEGGDRCTATNARHQRVTCASLAVRTTSEQASRFGSKIEYAVNLIQNKIAGYSIPKSEKVLVFVQYPQVQKKLAEGLKAAGIKVATMSDSLSSASTLSNFQAKKSKVQVLIILAGTETAAGR